MRLVQRRKVQVLALGYALTAGGIWLFWLGFHTGFSFPLEQMRNQIPNFEGYYAWERAFFLPDLLLSVAAVVVSRGLFRSSETISPRLALLAAAVSGACLFLGVLDISYDAPNGMYCMGNLFSADLLLVGMYLPGFALGSLFMLFRLIQKGK